MRLGLIEKRVTREGGKEKEEILSGRCLLCDTTGIKSQQSLLAHLRAFHARLLISLEEKKKGDRVFVTYLGPALQEPRTAQQAFGSDKGWQKLLT